MRSLKDGLALHVQFIKSGFAMPIKASNQLIHLYSEQGRIHEAQKLFDEIPERNVFSWNAIISAYIKSKNLHLAKTMFESATVRDLVSYNSMLSGYAGADGHEDEAIELFLEMQSKRCEIGMDGFTLTIGVNLCARLSLLCFGRQLHSYMVKTADDKSGFAVSSLIDMYSKCGCFTEACKVFEGCEVVIDLVSKNALVAACCREGDMDRALSLFWRDNECDVVSWNTLIAGYVQNGYAQESLKLFACMWKNGVKWNEYTFTSLLSACSSLRNLRVGKEIHACVLKNGLILNQFIDSGIIDVYCKCGNMKYAELMCPASGTNPFATTSMIVGYSLLGKMAEAQRFFDNLTEKNQIAWKALFSGYVKSEKCETVFELFSGFIAKEGMVPDAQILVSLLGACSLRAALRPGKEIHGFVFRTGIEIDKNMVSAMIDMYAKSGSIRYAENIFQNVTVRDLVVYNVMIASYANHGHETGAVQLFHEMLEKGVAPDAVTFVAILSACRHSGLVEMGEKLFYSMKEDHDITPEIDHYACIVDLYGRANQLEKAVSFMKNIPTELQDVVILGAFLNAYRLNRNSEFSKEVEEKLLDNEGDKGSRYVQLANLFAAEGNWAEMKRIRKRMRGVEKKKFPGCSWVHLNNGVHPFTSGDRTHIKADSIYSMLDCLTAEIYDVCGAFC